MLLRSVQAHTLSKDVPSLSESDNTTVNKHNKWHECTQMEEENQAQTNQ